MARFYLIDPSILDYQGHHFEYAQRVLRAAREAGFQPVMAVNRRCQVADASMRTRAVYRFGFWFASVPRSTPTTPAPTRPTANSGWLTPLIRLLYSPLGLRVARWRRWRDELPNVANGERSIAWLLPALGISAIASLGRSLATLVAGWIPFRASLQRVITALCGNASQFGARSRQTLRSYLGRHGVIATGVWRQLKRRQFERDTRWLLIHEPMAAGDIALLPVGSIVELLALERLFQRSPRLLQGTWHIVFRHNLYGPAAAQTYDESTRPLRNALRQFADKMPPGRFYFYTDSDELTAQYNSLGAVTFATLPVPVDRGFSVVRPTTSKQSPLNIVYAGDARREKGYQYLPKLVADVMAARGLPRPARFVIQSNASHGGSAAEIEQAFQQLREWHDDRVQLVTSPLTPDEYRRQLIGADLVVLPYDRESYFARSSGVLAEALAVGIPAIVPAGTWMARQLCAAHCDYHKSLLERLPTHVALDVSQATFSQERPAAFHVDVSQYSTYAIIAFRQSSAMAGQFAKVTVAQYDRQGRILSRRSHVVGGADGDAGCLVKLKRGVVRLRLDLRNAFSPASITLNALNVTLLQTALRIPRAIVGVVMNRPQELTHAALEVLRHYDHYRASAASFAPSWIARHCPERLVAELQREANGGESKPSPAHALRGPHFGGKKHSSAARDRA